MVRATWCSNHAHLACNCYIIEMAKRNKHFQFEKKQRVASEDKRAVSFATGLQAI